MTALRAAAFGIQLDFRFSAVAREGSPRTGRLAEIRPSLGCREW